MAEWGRKQYAKPWPSRAHVWTWGAFFLSCLFFVFMVWLDGRTELDGRGAAIPVGLSQERRAGEGRAEDAVEVHAAPGLQREGADAARDRRPSAGGEGCGRSVRVRPDRRGHQGRVSAVAIGDGRVQRSAAARVPGPVGLSEPNAVGLREAAHVLDAGVLRRAAVHGRAEGPCAADGLEVRATAARAGVGRRQRSSTRSWAAGNGSRLTSRTGSRS